MSAVEQIVEVISQVVVGPLQTTVAAVRVLRMEQKRELQSRRIRLDEVAHRAQHEPMARIGAAAERSLVTVASFGDHVERAEVVVDRLSGETEHAVRERAHHRRLLAPLRAITTTTVSKRVRGEPRTSACNRTLPAAIDSRYAATAVIDRYMPPALELHQSIVYFLEWSK